MLYKLKKYVYLSVYQSKKENIQMSISGCLPLVKAKALGHSSRLFFTLNRAKACYEGIVSVHNPNYNFFADRKNFPADISVKGRKNTLIF